MDKTVVVPVSATPEMIAAAEQVEDLYRRGTPQTWGRVYQAMIAAAPAPAAQGERDELSDEQIRFRFFKDLTADQRLAVFKVFGVYPDGCEEKVHHYIERLLLKQILKRRAALTAPHDAQERDADKSRALAALLALHGAAQGSNSASPDAVLASASIVLEFIDRSTAQPAEPTLRVAHNETGLAVSLAAVAHRHVENGNMRHDVGLALLEVAKRFYAKSQQLTDEEIFALSEKHMRFTPTQRLLHDDGLLTFARALLAAQGGKDKSAAPGQDGREG